MFPHSQKLLASDLISGYAIGLADSTMDALAGLLRDRILKGEITVEQAHDVLQEILAIVLCIYKNDSKVIFDTPEPIIRSEHV